MTTSDGLQGPPAPNRSAAGLSLGPEWKWSPPGHVVQCPGSRTDRRQDPARGDRRLVNRPGPCGYHWGHATAGGWMRLARVQNEPAPTPTWLLKCKRCHATVEFLTVAAEAA